MSETNATTEGEGEIRCPHCTQTYAITPEQVPLYAGRAITCTQCHQPFALGADLAAKPVPVAQAYAAPRPVGPSLSTGGSAPTPPAMSRSYGADISAYGGRPEYVLPASNGMAIASLVCGILSFFTLVSGVPAIVCGIIGLRRTSNNPNVGGKGLAIAGIATGLGGLLLCGGFAMSFYMTVARFRQYGVNTACDMNLRQIGAAVTAYSNNHRGRCPDTLDDLSRSNPGQFATVCPADANAPAPGGTGLARSRYSSYAYVGKGLTLKHLSSSSLVLVYEPLGHHGNGTHFLYADGHTEFLMQPLAGRMIADLQAGKNPPPSAGKP